MKLAFKNALVAGLMQGPIHGEFSRLIRDVTGGEYSHVQMWLDGPRNAARCFSAFEPDGTRFQVDDLTDAALWTIVDMDPATAATPNATADNAWCKGRCTRRYNFLGIVGSLFEGPLTDKYDDFCSQCCFEFLQDMRGLFPLVNSVTVAPSSGKPKRVGLFQLVIAAGFAVTP